MTGTGTGPYCGTACERHLSLGLFGDEVGKLTIAGTPFGGMDPSHNFSPSGEVEVQSPGYGLQSCLDSIHLLTSAMPSFYLNSRTPAALSYREEHWLCKLLICKTLLPLSVSLQPENRGSLKQHVWSTMAAKNHTWPLTTDVRNAFSALDTHSLQD